jgi:hypothetical protein
VAGVRRRAERWTVRRSLIYQVSDHFIVVACSDLAALLAGVSGPGGCEVRRDQWDKAVSWIGTALGGGVIRAFAPQFAGAPLRG